MISNIWYYNDWAFQKVGNTYNLYDKNGDFVRSFFSFESMTKFIEEQEKQ